MMNQPDNNHPESSTPNRRWFSLRKFVVLVLLLATLGWLGNMVVQFQKREKIVVQEIQNAGGKVEYDVWHTVQIVDFGDTNLLDAGLNTLTPHLKKFTRLKRLNLDNTQITDAGLAHLKSLPRIQELSLRGTRVTNSGLEHLKNLPELKWLVLEDTRITDAGLEHLKNLVQLQLLNLKGTKISQPGMVKFKHDMRGTVIID